jgi:hypothetical protein
MMTREHSLESVRALARNELSFKARVGYVALVLAATIMIVVILSLWLTEPTLPVRTQVAFGLMTIIGASWVALASWALGARRLLFARDRVIAGRMAVAFTSLFVVGTGFAVVLGGGAAAFGALGAGLLMLGAAYRALSSARHRFAALAARRAELEQALSR